MNEFKLYIIDFDLITWLGFIKKSISKYKRFLNYTTFIIWLICIIIIILTFVRDFFAVESLIFIEFQNYMDFYDYLLKICIRIRDFFI